MAEAYVIRGAVRDEQGDQVGALADYDQAIELKPDLAEAYVGRGNVRDEQGDWVGALADYDQAIELNPEYAEVYVSRGNVRCEQGDQVGALADYDQAIELEPELAEAYAIRGVVHFIQGGLNLSLEDFEVYCRLKKDDPLGHNNRAFILFQLGRTAEAERAWKRATKLPNASHYAFAGHAVALQKLKRYMQAKSKFQIAINMDARWMNDIQGIAKEFLWTDEMIWLAQEIAKHF